ncbi:MAG: hypothetical protein QOI12_4189 [Alphaproteobacteria bacterium]|jgi:hypothetical protein|nr:hypothetical protein [Alphaproteobacteria bacterium]
MTRVTPEQPWTVPLAVHEVPEIGRHVELTADAATRAAIADVAGLRALPRLQAAFDVAPHGAGGLHVVGTVSASIGQTCIVTLEPIESEIDEPVDVVFAPGAARTLVQEEGDQIEIIAHDAAEPLVGNAIDLGAIATEFLLLGIDPYPRKPGAVFEAPAADDGSAHPFAALAALKKGQGTP